MLYRAGQAREPGRQLPADEGACVDRDHRGACRQRLSSLLADRVRCGGQRFDERRTGLDHISFGVADRASLDVWASGLDELGIEHSSVIDAEKPMPYSVVVFRDPDNIQLELIYLAA
jgi:catechol 2,3-dioxygenase-like lactoylglutathione lyase family enzyme